MRGQLPKKFVVIITLLLCVSLTGAQDGVLTLEDCIEHALQSNLKFMRAGEKRIESESMMREASTGYLPKLSGSASYSRLVQTPTMLFSFPGMPETEIDVGNRNNFNASLLIQQPIFTGGKIASFNRMAQFAYEASGYEQKTAQKDITRDVTQAYYNVLASRRSLVALDSSIVLLERLVHDLENAVEVGMRGEHELLAAQVQLLNQQLSRRQAQNGVESLSGYLSALLGLSQGKPLKLHDYIAEPQELDLPSVERLVEKARKEFPEIQTLERQLLIAETQLRVAGAANIPSLFASAGYSGQSIGIETLDWQDNMSLTLALQWDIFDWGASRHKRSAALSQYRQLQLTVQEVKNSMEYVVRNSYRSLQEAYESIAISRKNVEQSKRSYQVTHDRFGEGLVPNSELLQAQNMRLQSEIAFYRALSDYYSRHADLEYLIKLENK